MLRNVKSNPFMLDFFFFLIFLSPKTIISTKLVPVYPSFFLYVSNLIDFSTSPSPT